MIYNGIFEYVERDCELFITNYLGSNTKELVIPDTINGIPVVSIETDAFKKNGKDITNIVLSNELLYINEFSFGGCDNLTKIVVPGSVITVFDDAFSGCINLEAIAFKNAARIHYFPDFLGDCYLSIKKIKTDGRCPFMLMKYILNYAIEHNVKSLIEDEYLERIAKKSFEQYIKQAREKEEVAILQRLVVIYNKRFGDNNLDM